MESSICTPGLLLNPLDIPSIVLNVVKLLDLKDLKMSRLVNRTWLHEANKYFCQVPMHFHQFYLISLQQIPTMYIPEFRYWHLPTLVDLTCSALKNPSALQAFKTFSFTDWVGGNRIWDDFVSIFGPHLESLVITTTDGRERYLGNPYGYQPRPIRFDFRRLLTCLPRLTSLGLDVGLWDHFTWTEEQGVPSLSLTSLTSLKLVPINLFERGLFYSALITGAPDWAVEKIWTVLKMILKSCPNLKSLSTCENYLPGQIFQEIFANPVFSLESLLLGGFGEAYSVRRRNELDITSSIRHGSIFFEHLIGNPAIAKIKVLKLPRPDRARADDWIKLFGWISSTIVELDLGEIVQFDQQQNGDPKDPLDGIPFEVPMNRLKSLSLTLSMLSVSTISAGVFPNVDKLTVIIDVDVFTPFSEVTNSTLAKNLTAVCSSITKLCLSFKETLLCHDEVAVTIFPIFAQNLTNVSTIKIDGCVGTGGLTAFFEAFQTGLLAEKIETLYVKVYSYCRSYRCRESLRDEFNQMRSSHDVKNFSRQCANPGCKTVQNLHVLFTGVQVQPEEDDQGHEQGQGLTREAGTQTLPSHQGLRGFKNLKNLYLRLLTCLEINRDFVEKSICHLPKLNTLEFDGIPISKDACETLKLLPGLENFKHSSVPVNRREPII